MKKILVLLLAMAVVNSCGTAKIVERKALYSISTRYDKAFNNAYKEINAKDLKKNLYIIAADNMEGRNTGSKGQKKAGEYIVNYYKKLGISGPKALNSYYQKCPPSL